MLKKSKEYSLLKNKWKKYWKKEVLEIFVFGSIVKGKYRPNDIDLCFVFRDKINPAIIKEAEVLLGEQFHLSSLRGEDFFYETHSLARTILLEGRSILSGKTLAENYGLAAKLFFSYDLSLEESSKKVRFVYLLRGRNGSEGLVKKFGGEFIANNVFLLPIDKDKEMQEVIDLWKIKYHRRKVLLMD